MAYKNLTSVGLIALAMLNLVPANQAFAAPKCEFVFTQGAYTLRPKIVVISGTNRTDSNTLKVSNQIRDIYAAQGAEVEVLDIAQVSPTTYKGDAYFNTPKTFQKNYDAKFANADGVVIVFPEYFGTYPGMLGTFMNYLTASFQSKPVSVVGISSGILGGQKGAEDLGTTLRHRKADIIGEAQVNIPEVEKAMTDGQVTNPNIVGRLNKAASAMLRRVKQSYDKDEQVNKFLDIAKVTPTSLTFKLNSGVEVRGKLNSIRRDDFGRPIYLAWKGATELRENGISIPGQGVGRHGEGFSTPVGPIKTAGGTKTLSSFKSLDELASIGLKADEVSELVFESGVKVNGIFKGATFSANGALQLLTFDQVTVTLGKEVMYQPSWGVFDLAVGEKVVGIEQ